MKAIKIIRSCSKKIILTLILAISTLSLASCGGNSDGDKESAQYQVSTDVSIVQLETIIEGNNVISNSIEVTASFTGDGVIVGYAPGVEPPIWLDITTVSTSNNSAVFELTPLYYGYEPGEYTTNLRFVTGKLDGSVIEYTSVKVTLTVEEYLGVKLTESVFIPVADSTEEDDLTASIIIYDNATGTAVTDYDWEFVSSSEDWLSLSQSSGDTSSQESGPEVSIDKSLLLDNPTGERYEAELIIVTEHEKYGRKEHSVQINAFTKMPYVAIDNPIPNELDFSISNADISLSNNLLLSLSENGRRVYITDISTFNTIGYYPLNGEPRGMSISPNGQLLYISIYDNGPFETYIGVIDLSTGFMINKFEISGGNQYDVINLVGNDTGEVFVSGRGSQDKYNAFTGTLTSSAAGYSQDKAYTLSSDQTATYAISLSSYDYELYHITPNQEDKTVLEVTVSEAPSYLGTKLWLDTTNNILLTEYGHVFNTDNLMHQSRIISDEQGIKDAAIDLVNNKVFIAEWSWSRGSEGEKEIIYSYDLPNFDNEQVVTSDGSDIRYIFMVNGQLLLIEWYDSNFKLRYL